VYSHPKAIKEINSFKTNGKKWFPEVVSGAKIPQHVREMIDSKTPYWIWLYCRPDGRMKVTRLKTGQRRPGFHGESPEEAK
jgi:hypothetical protein